MLLLELGGGGCKPAAPSHFGEDESMSDDTRRGQRFRDAVKRVKLAVDRLEAARANPEAVKEALRAAKRWIEDRR